MTSCWISAISITISCFWWKTYLFSRAFYVSAIVFVLIKKCGGSTTWRGMLPVRLGQIWLVCKGRMWAYVIDLMRSLEGCLLSHFEKRRLFKRSAQNTIQKSISIVFCVSGIRHDPSLSKYRKQKQSPPGNIQNGTRPGGWLLLFTVLAHPRSQGLTADTAQCQPWGPGTEDGTCRVTNHEE